MVPLRARSVSHLPESRTTREVKARLPSGSKEVTVGGESSQLEYCGAISTQTCPCIHTVFIESLLWVRHNFR